jgi:2-dehydropantoate 2-reductase
MRAAGIEPARLGPIPVRFFPLILSLPTPILRVIARAQLKIDPEARSSMWEDLEKRRATEVDYLNGEVVRLAAKHGAKAPLNERIVALVHEVEAAKNGSPQLGPDELWAKLMA